MARKRNDPTQKLAVLSPYDELENLLNAARKIDEMEEKYQFMEKKYVAIQQLYREIMEKVTEINRYL